MNKIYKPIKFKNPTSNQHIVRLKPGQNLELDLDKNTFIESRVFLNSDLATLQAIKKQEFSKRFNVFQKSFVLKWLEYSSLYLGCVEISSNICNSKITMIAESTNALKSNVLTILNPNDSFVRLIPGDILEVVLFDKENPLEDQEWQWSFSGVVDCDIELLRFNYFVFDPKNNDHSLCPDLTFAALSRVQEKSVQCHFWFRFDKRLMGLLDATDYPPQQMGELVFLEKNKNTKHSISINMILHKKHKTRVLNSLLLPKFDCKPLEHDDEFINLNTLNTVKIKKINSASIFEGCRVKSILPDSFDVLSSPCGTYDEESF
jgi:hypothetical protein